MNDQQIHRHLSELDGWQLNLEQSTIWRDFKFQDFHQTMDFVNAVATIAHAEDHHPEMEIGYKHCLVNYTTHSANGLSEHDFECARQIDALINSKL